MGQDGISQILQNYNGMVSIFLFGCECYVMECVLVLLKLIFILKFDRVLH